MLYLSSNQSSSYPLLFFLLSLPLLPMEKPSFHSLSAPREEFPEPPSSTRIILTSGCVLFPGLITLVRKPSFSGLESENPYHHLSDFEQLCSLFAIIGMTQDTLKWKLFPFSLIGKAEQWYTYTVGSVHDNWDELRTSPVLISSRCPVSLLYIGIFALSNKMRGKALERPGTDS